VNQRDQRKVGIPARPRGQETGFGNNPDQNLQKMEDTPAIRGRRKNVNKMFADKSSQQAGSDAVTPSTTSPSTTAMHTDAKGETGGERVFKKRLAKKRSAR
jgi:hypothetical protein